MCITTPSWVCIIVFKYTTRKPEISNITNLFNTALIPLSSTPVSSLSQTGQAFNYIEVCAVCALALNCVLPVPMTASCSDLTKGLPSHPDRTPPSFVTATCFFKTMLFLQKSPIAILSTAFQGQTSVD
jgi:hypothetical protein